ncbi:MAG TPA: CDP-diacylglycerol--glycerol-3-phosphate 3-phosphatidyltransferase [Thermoguttaceae bacterium]|nr:CDP-diacylglycerol--glycerol-3-phosphate 3-phosphatidyltransferase [Thermoguttaceae bacterium]
MKATANRLEVIWNFPNLLSGFRLVLAVGLFAALAWELYGVSLAIFLLASGTDWLDGWYARRYGQVTFLGRILDPFADKVIICGAFIFLLSARPLVEMAWGLRPWMVVVIVGREMFVTAIRSFLEQRGIDFSATWSGKWKMLLQSAAVIAALVYLSYPIGPERMAWLEWVVLLTLWAALVLTVLSGLIYALAASRLLRRQPSS